MLERLVVLPVLLLEEIRKPDSLNKTIHLSGPAFRGELREGKPLKRISRSKIVKALKMRGKLAERESNRVGQPNASSVLTGEFHREQTLTALLHFLSCCSHTTQQVYSLLSHPSP